MGETHRSGREFADALMISSVTVRVLDINLRIGTDLMGFTHPTFA
jgi:hypothetical protein